MGRIREAVQTIRQKGKFSDSPSDRLRDLAVRLVSDPTLPNATLGGLMVALVGYLSGYVSLLGLVVNVGAWLVSLAIFAVGDEIRIVLEAIAAERADPDPEDEAGYQ